MTQIAPPKPLDAVLRDYVEMADGLLDEVEPQVYDLLLPESFEAPRCPKCDQPTFGIRAVPRCPTWLCPDCSGDVTGGGGPL